MFKNIYKNNTENHKTGDQICPSIKSLIVVLHKTYRKIFMSVFFYILTIYLFFNIT